MLAMVKDQTKAWTEMVHRHKKEEWEMLKSHMKVQEEQFKAIPMPDHIKDETR